MKVLGFLILLLSTFYCHADMQWTDGSYLGAGKDVTMVYPQFVNRDIIFQTDDGKKYKYHWGDSEHMTDNAKIVYSTLLTALTAGRKVSIYYDAADTSSIVKASLVNIK